MQHELLARLAHRFLARGAVRAGLEVDVAQTAASSVGENHFLAVAVEVGHDLAGFGVTDYGADRHPQRDVLAPLAVAVFAAAVFAALGAVAAGVAIVEQGVDVAVGDREDVAAMAAIAAIRSAEGDEFFAPERGDAVAAVASVHFDSGFVEEFHRCVS